MYLVCSQTSCCCEWGSTALVLWPCRYMAVPHAGHGSAAFFNLSSIWVATAFTMASFPFLYLLLGHSNSPLPLPFTPMCRSLSSLVLASPTPSTQPLATSQRCRIGHRNSYASPATTVALGCCNFPSLPFNLHDPRYNPRTIPI